MGSGKEGGGWRTFTREQLYEDLLRLGGFGRGGGRGGDGGGARSTHDDGVWIDGRIGSDTEDGGWRLRHGEDDGVILTLRGLGRVALRRAKCRTEQTRSR